jgi:hypothetical protein
VKLCRYDAGRSTLPDAFATEVETPDMAERLKAIFFDPDPPWSRGQGARTCEGEPARSRVTVEVRAAGRASFVGIDL